MKYDRNNILYSRSSRESTSSAFLYRFSKVLNYVITQKTRILVLPCLFTQHQILHVPGLCCGLFFLSFLTSQQKHIFKDMNSKHERSDRYNYGAWSRNKNKTTIAQEEKKNYSRSATFFLQRI